MPGPSNTLTDNQNLMHSPYVFVALEPEIGKVPSKLRAGTEDLEGPRKTSEDYVGQHPPLLGESWSEGFKRTKASDRMCGLAHEGLIRKAVHCLYKPDCNPMRMVHCLYKPNCNPMRAKS